MIIFDVYLHQRRQVKKTKLAKKNICIKNIISIWNTLDYQTHNVFLAHKVTPNEFIVRSSSGVVHYQLNKI